METSYIAYSPPTATSKPDKKKDAASFLTIPIDTTQKQQTTEKRKGSVTFDLPLTLKEEEEKDTRLLSPCVTSPTIDICAQAVPDTMLVALFDREQEMKELVLHNKTFFSSLQSHLGQDKWPRFANTLYCERSKMSDIEWMSRISKALQGAPSLLEMFKELVGYLGDEDEDDQDTVYSASSSASEQYFSNVELARIRDCPHKISKESYPQFYINCEQQMNNSDEYNQFLNILFLTDRQALPDEVWESKVYEQLHNWPNLLEQLQEIVAYEIEEDK